MSNRQKQPLEFDRWEEGPGFVPVWKGRSAKPRIHPGLALGPWEGRGMLRQTLKPVGFYVTYSYTLFRRGDQPHDPLFAFY